MKKLMIGVVACAALFSSCSKNEVADINPSNSNAINFTATTTRASINDLTSLQGDGTGFKVYATSGAAPAAWYTNVDGSNNYKYATTWQWAGTPALWPTTTGGYPMNFYAYYPASHASYGTFTVTAGSALSAPITIQNAVAPDVDDAATQADLLAAKANTSAKPGDGYLPLAFTHILSKVNFGIIAGTGTSVSVQSIVVKNVKNANTYDYVASSWGATATGSVSHNYFNTAYTAGTAKPVFTPATADDATANPIYAAGHTKHLMLMPQTTASWNKSTTVADAYIEVVYRISTTGNPNNVGYTSANDHPAYVAGTHGATLNGEPLFVKVGFPLAAGNFTWDPAKGYTYNIKLGTADATGGFYTETNYVDEDGATTTLPIFPTKNVGDPVSSGTINFTLSIANWADQAPGALN